MSEQQPCSALVHAPAPGTTGRSHCKHGHAITAPCHGISADTLAPVCVQEHRQFDERTKTVCLQHWRGA